MIFFTSDLHFSHNRLFVYEPRGFSSIEEMNKEIVNRWNDIVEPADTVYVLGDLMLVNNDEGMEYLSQLNGSIYVVLGNHDTNRRIELYNSLDNVTILGYGDILKYKKYHFYLSHYPTITANNEDADAPLRKYVINLFGHTHQKEHFYNGNPLMYNVGMDAHDCYPICIDEIIEEIRAEHHKNICNS